MVMENVTILIIIGIMIVVFLRAKKTQYALSVIPFVFVPGTHLLGLYFAQRLDFGMGFTVHQISVGIDILALVVGCLLLGLLSHNILSKKSRSVFLVMGGLFNLLLTWILILNTIQT